MRIPKLALVAVSAANIAEQAAAENSDRPVSFAPRFPGAAEVVAMPAKG